MAHEEEKHVKGALYIGNEVLLGMITCVCMKKIATQLQFSAVYLSDIFSKPLKYNHQTGGAELSLLENTGTQPQGKKELLSSY